VLELSWLSGIGGFVELGVTERGAPVTTYAAYPLARRRVYVDPNGFQPYTADYFFYTGGESN
jgi:hypothetical protein